LSILNITVNCLLIKSIQCESFGHKSFGTFIYYAQPLNSYIQLYLSLICFFSTQLEVCSQQSSFCYTIQPKKHFVTCFESPTFKALVSQTISNNETYCTCITLFIVRNVHQNSAFYIYLLMNNVSLRVTIEQYALVYSIFCACIQNSQISPSLPRSHDKSSTIF